MTTRLFVDEDEKIWMVTKLGSTLKVKGQRIENVKLHEIAKSCAVKLGVTQTKSGVPLDHINEHRRIWNTIWDKGTPFPDPSGQAKIV